MGQGVAAGAAGPAAPSSTIRACGHSSVSPGDWVHPAPDGQALGTFQSPVSPHCTNAHHTQLHNGTQGQPHTPESRDAVTGGHTIPYTGSQTKQDPHNHTQNPAVTRILHSCSHTHSCRESLLLSVTLGHPGATQHQCPTCSERTTSHTPAESHTHARPPSPEHWQSGLRLSPLRRVVEQEHLALEPDGQSLKPAP